MFDYSIEFTLFAIFLSAITIYVIKGKKLIHTDILYGFILAVFYYFLLSFTYTLLYTSLLL